MLFVRNPTGVSHSPVEFAEMADCLAGVEALADVAGRAGRGRFVTAYVLERAWVDGAVHDDVYVEIEAGRFSAVELDGHPSLEGVATPSATGYPVDRGSRPIPGLTIPGLANCHSHAFHRALRGRTQQERGTFWTWRERMYAVAERLDPDSYLALARATYREMVAAGITSVGEFHYLHHQPDGTPYDDPNAMGHALVAGGRGGGPPDQAARHGVPQQRLRRATRGRPAAVLATAPRTRWARTRGAR